MGALLAQRLATRIQPLAMVLLTPAPPRGINALTPAVIGAFAPWMFSGMFWRNAHKPGFAHARRFGFNGVPEDRHRTLYDNMVHESGRAAFAIGLWPLEFARAAAVDRATARCRVSIVRCV